MWYASDDPGRFMDAPQQAFSVELIVVERVCVAVEATRESETRWRSAFVVDLAQTD
jgi:hypothetical protein